jgi:hypothetical protein
MKRDVHIDVNTGNNAIGESHLTLCQSSWMAARMPDSSETAARSMLDIVAIVVPTRLVGGEDSDHPAGVPRLRHGGVAVR